jgi:hypothetical protein
MLEKASVCRTLGQYISESAKVLLSDSIQNISALTISLNQLRPLLMSDIDPLRGPLKYTICRANPSISPF